MSLCCLYSSGCPKECTVVLQREGCQQMHTLYLILRETKTRGSKYTSFTGQWQKWSRPGLVLHWSHSCSWCLNPRMTGTPWCFWQLTKQGLSTDLHTVLLLKLTCFCLQHIHYSSPQAHQEKAATQVLQLEQIPEVSEGHKPISPLPMHQIWTPVSSDLTFCTTSLQPTP